MSTILFILLFTLNVTNVKSQIKFNKIYELDSGKAVSNMLYSIIPIESSRYYFTGNNLDVIDYNNSNFSCGYMNDTGLILISKKNYIDSVSNFYHEHSIGFHNKFYTTTCGYNRVKTAYEVYLYCFDENLDTIWTRKMELSKYLINPEKIITNQKGNIVVVGGILNCWLGCPVKDFFWELDTFGNILQLDTSLSAHLFDITASKIDNGYLCIGKSFVGDQGQNQIYKIDSLGHQIWYQTLGGVGDDGSLSIENISDTIFVVSGFRRIVKYGQPYANLIILSESNRLIRDFLPSTADVLLQDIEKLVKRGSFYYGFGYSQDVRDSVVIFSMDSSFNFIWARYYYRNSGTNRLFDFRATSDGGFIACGDLIGPLNQDGWVLKLDSLGCDVSNCWIKDTTADTATIIIPAYSALQNIKIYPNPIRDKFQVEFESMDFEENYSIEIKNMLGEIIFTRTLDETKSEIDIYSLDAALYFYEIKNKNGMRVACGKLLKE